MKPHWQYWVIFGLMVVLLATLAIALVIFHPAMAEGPEPPSCWMHPEFPRQVRAGETFTVTVTIDPWWPEQPDLITVTVMSDEGICFGVRQISSAGGGWWSSPGRQG